jgi:hypothetical protein
MIKALEIWRIRRRYRTLYRHLSGIDANRLVGTGLTASDLAVLRRGRSPWRRDDPSSC